MKYIPNMTSDRAWELTNQVHYEGQATVWVGPQEQAELYHQQLSRAGLTMAPLEAA
jgi:ATP-dependent Clp protease adaptor protein ClpS